MGGGALGPARAARRAAAGASGVPAGRGYVETDGARPGRAGMLALAFMALLHAI